MLYRSTCVPNKFLKTSVSVLRNVTTYIFFETHCVNCFDFVRIFCFCCLSKHTLHHYFNTVARIHEKAGFWYVFVQLSLFCLCFRLARIVVSSSVRISLTKALFFAVRHKSDTICTANFDSMDPDDPEWLTLHLCAGIVSFILLNLMHVVHFFKHKKTIMKVIREFKFYKNNWMWVKIKIKRQNVRKGWWRLRVQWLLRRIEWRKWQILRKRCLWSSNHPLGQLS